MVSATTSAAFFLSYRSPYQFQHSAKNDLLKTLTLMSVAIALIRVDFKNFGPKKQDY